MQHKEARQLPPCRLDPAKPAELVKALDHPNGWVRGTAQRLLSEGSGSKIVSALTKTVKSGSTPYARINALWTLNDLGKLDRSLLLASLQDKDHVLRGNALRLASERESHNDAAQHKAILADLNDSDPPTRLKALIALGSFSPSPETARTIAQSKLRSRNRIGGDEIIFLQ